MKNVIWVILASVLLFAACSDSETEVEYIPEDANENYVTSVVMTVDGVSYAAEIVDNTITVTVPYTVSLDNAEVSFEYTSSATIVPDPTTITDWDTERVFRVTSYNGESKDYTYLVIKDEIRYEGDIVLATNAEIANFVESAVSVIKGSLTIGSDDEDAEEITDISALSILKEVEGIVTLKNSYNGQDLTGLDNVTTIGGLQIGSEESVSTSSDLHMVYMKSLETVAGDINIYNHNVVYVQFDNLETIEGDLKVNSLALTTFEFPSLTTVGGDVEIQALDEDDNSEGIITKIEMPSVSYIGGELYIHDIATLTAIKFPLLVEAGSINIPTISGTFDTLSFPEITTINGHFTLKATININDGGFGSTAGTSLTEIDGFDKLTTVKGTISFSWMQKLEYLPDFSNITTLGGLYLAYLYSYYDQELDLSNADFVSFNDEEPTITIDCGTYMNKIITKDDLSNVTFNLTTSANTGASNPIEPELNIKTIKNFTYRGYDVTGEYSFPFVKVVGDINITKTNSKDSILLPELTEVEGYFAVSGSYIIVQVPKLETIGGQCYIVGLSNSEGGHDFSSLRTVSCSENPSFAVTPKQFSSYAKAMYYTSLHVSTSNTSTNYAELPALEKVGGDVCFYGPTTITCPKLETIEGTINFIECKRLTELSFPSLKTFSGAYFYKMTKLTDFSFWAPFIQDGQITEDYWDTYLCGYNPTYQDMVDGNYTSE